MAFLAGWAKWWRLHTLFSDEPQAWATLVGPEPCVANGGAVASSASGMTFSGGGGGERGRGSMLVIV